MTHFFEDFEPGLQFDSDARRIREEDVAAFAALSGDHNPLHEDEAAAQRAGFDGRIAHGVLGIAVATGLLSATGLTRESLIAMLGLSWRFEAPVRIGETVRARVRVIDRRPSSRPDRGVVTFSVEVMDEAGRVMQRGEIVELVRRRP